MPPIQDRLAALLKTVRTPGDFFSSGEWAMYPPQLRVAGAGLIALPLLPSQAVQLIALAERAPYGRGEETLIDTSVRRTWQVGADKVAIQGKHWAAGLDQLVQRVSLDLGVGTPAVPELYKLLIYDEGSFFVSHRDSEKSAGMFATLIIALPSEHSGGELLVRHGSREVRLDLRSSDPAEAAYAAFYADCVHEVLPVTSGCRLALVYNLLRRGRGKAPRPPNYDVETAALVALLQGWSSRHARRSAAPLNDGAAAREANALASKLVYPLEHAYTPAELAFAALKGADAAAAVVVMAAAEQANCDLHLVLMQIEESGSADYTGRGSHRRWGGYHDDTDDDEFEVGEVCERNLNLTHWIQADGTAADLGSFPFTDDELCPIGAFDDVEADEQHFQEATGNEGASFDRRYQRAALVLWPHAQRLRVLAGAGPDVALRALAQRVSEWTRSGTKVRQAVWDQAHALAGHMIGQWLTRAGSSHGVEFDADDDWLDDDDDDGDASLMSGMTPGRGSRPRQANPASAAAQLLVLLARLKDVEHIAAFIAKGSPASDADDGWCYTADDNAAIVAALRALPAPQAGHLVLNLVHAHSDMHMGGCVDLLARIGSLAAAPAHWLPAAQAMVAALPGDAPHRAPQPRHWQRESMTANAVSRLLPALDHIDAALAIQAVELIMVSPGTYGLDTVVVPALRILAGVPAHFKQAAVQRLRSAGLAHLLARVDQPLAAPTDWARQAKLSCSCAHCTALSHFLDSATESTWRLRARESDRSHVQTTIKSDQSDVDCLVERKGSPHVLVCTKNQATYERRVAQRKMDQRDLRQLASPSG